MKLQLPKPMHGWRLLAGEIGIIVVGVLVALGAQQVVETLHWHNEVRQFRIALDGELGQNTAALRYRISQERCVGARIAALESWRDDARAGRPLRTIGEIGRPSLYALSTGVWESRTGDLMRQMPLAVSIRYSSLYDQFDNVAVQTRDEREAWRSLSSYNGSSSLSEAELKRLTELIYRVKSLDRVLQRNWEQASRQTAEVGIRPDFGDIKAFVQPPDPAFCAPLLRS
jgi:hypothetical protein